MTDNFNKSITNSSSDNTTAKASIATEAAELNDLYKNLSTASHEIMNYLATINSTYQLIGLKHPETANYQFWDKLGMSLNELIAYMNRTSLCRYVHSPKPSSIAFNNVLTTALKNIYEHEIYTNKLLIDNNLDKSIKIFADEDQLSLALTEILLNACEEQLLTSTNSPVVVKLNQNDNKITIEVINQLTDSTSIDTNHMTDAFYTTKAHHTGVGLYIANMVCLKSSGALTIKKLNNCLSVTILLPLEGK